MFGEPTLLYPQVPYFTILLNGRTPPLGHRGLGDELVFRVIQILN
jgi:hypothetical protein